MSDLLYEQESYKIRGAAFDVYKSLGCGHKEVVYQRACHEALTKRELKVEREKRIDVIFEGKKVGTYTPDFLIEDKIVLETKAKKMITQQDVKQFWDYLTGSNYKLGFLINFGKPGGVEIIRKVYDTARQKNSAYIPR